MRRRRDHARWIVGAALLTFAVGCGATLHDHTTSSGAAGAVSMPTTASVPSSPPAQAAMSGQHRAALQPCARNDRPQWVVVSLRRQHMWACARHRTIISTPVTTGATSRGDATPRGSFAVQGLDRNSRLTTTASGSYSVKYWIPFHLGVWGFHDASWQHIPFGSSRYRQHGSHGCVHVPLPAMRQLFHWVNYGTVVRVR